MGQTPRDTAPGIHHVVVGATGQEDYYLDDPDRFTWTRRFMRTLDRFGWTCISVCQLTTHVHTMVDIPDESISRGMHYLNSFYGKYFNEKNGRRGNLVRSRYWSKRVVDDEQLVAAFRYVARNPVRAGLCTRPEDWLWSGFATSCGLAQTFPFVDASQILAALGANEANAAQLLRALVRE
jgi:putative transposase